MASRYRLLTAYSLLLAALAVAWLAHGLSQAEALPPVGVQVLWIAACLFVWQFGIPAPRVGLTSMERLPQIGTLLIFSPPVAAAICAAASLLWPLVSRTYSHGSLKVAALRALHNAAMTALMLLLAAQVYFALGGRHPLDGLGAADVLPLVALALTAQVVNVALLALFFHLDGRDVRRIIKPVYSLLDLLFVPAGVLAAVLYNVGTPATFGLFAALMVIFVLSFNGIGRTLSAAETDTAPLAKLSGTRRAFHGARRIDELAERILTETRALFRFDEFCLALVDRDQQVFDVRVHERGNERQPARSQDLRAGLYGFIAERAEPVLIESWQRAPEELRQRAQASERQAGSLIAVPLVEDGAVIGLLSVQHTQTEVYSDADLHLMQRLADQVAAAIADARAFEDLEDYRQRLEERVAERTQELDQANREKERLIAALGERSRMFERESQEDPLTGIANRRCFTQRLAAEIELARAVGNPLTLAVGDLDHFKIVNDRLGHAVGDEVLRQSAALMRQLCRHSDLVARIGGEEFALILPGMPRAAAIDFCEAMRVAVETHDWRRVHPHLRVTLSIGLSQWDGRADVAELLQSADTHLYRAKREGRNRVA
ncbi:MAG TPA: sensor domain-containing diguanylate cyclase [Steroidobacteraceae bacterium]|nr:sensor domain-containing diguanylate cyclase [Steroidobacteraceae bacterium]